MVRFQLAFSLGEANDDPRVIAALATIAVQDAESPWTRTAVLSSIAGRPLALFDVLARTRRLLRRAARASLARRAGVTWSAQTEPAGIAASSSNRLASSRRRSVEMMRVVLALARGLQRAGGSFQTMLARGRVLARIASLLAEAARLAGSTGRSIAGWSRSGCLAWRCETARRLLPDLLDARQPTAVQLAVLQALSGLLRPRGGRRRSSSTGSR